MISAFKELIDDRLEYWSDLEIALGRKTLTYPLNTRKGFKECKHDLDIHLKRYLQEQNNRVQEPSQEDIDVFKQSIVKFPMSCSPGFRKDLQKIYNSHKYESYEYNIVDFNFTNTVNIFWDKIPSNAFWHNIRYPRLLPEETFHINDRKGQLFHIHGTLNNAMMTGVGEPSQLGNTVFQRTDLITSLCVKPIMNENCRNEIEDKVLKSIDTTDVFVIYGMSIGITDVKWWKHVVQRLLEHNDSYLVIVNYDGEYDQALPYTSSLVAKRIIANLIEVSGCLPEYQNRLQSKIAVLLNTKLFSFNSLLREESLVN